MNILTKNNIIILLAAVVLFLLSVIVWQRQTIRQERNEPRYFAEYDTTITNVVRTDTVRPAPITLVETVYKDRFFTDTVFTKVDAEVDTLAILTDYYAERTYKNALIDNDTLTFNLTEIVSENRIKQRCFDYSLTIPERTITKTERIPQRGLYFNTNLMLNRGFDRLGLDANLIYINKNKRLFNIGAAYTDELYFKAGIGFKF